MKTNFFKKLSLFILGGVMALGVGVGLASSKGVGEVEAEEASIELCTSWGKVLAYTTEYTKDYTIDDLKGSSTTMTLAVKGVYRQSDKNTYFQMNKKTGYFKNTTKLPGKITKIETAWSVAKGPTKCYFADSAEASSVDKTVIVTAATSVTYTPPSDKNYFYFNIDVSTGSGSAQLTSCSVYYETAGSIDKLNSINIASESGSSLSLSEASVKTDKELQVYLTANYQNKGSIDKTDEAEWSTTPGTGSVEVNKGKITGKTVGTATVSASFGDKSASLNVIVLQGPSIKISKEKVLNFCEKEVRNDITVSAENFSGTPVITASSNSTNLTAEILSNGNLQITGGNQVTEDETVTVTVTGDDGSDTASATLLVYLKAPIFSLSPESIKMKPNANAVDIVATTNYFISNVTISAESYDSSLINVTINDSVITVKPLKEGTGSLVLKATDGTIAREKTVPIEIADVTEYCLIKDDSDLIEGTKVLIVNTNVNTKNSYAMASQNGTYRSCSSISISNEKIAGPENVEIVELEGNEGAWYLKVSDGYLCYNSGSNNTISTVEKKDDSNTWTIAIDESNNTAIRPFTSTSRLISFNNTANPKRFACYPSTQTNGEINIYGIIAAPKTIKDSRIIAGTVSAQTGDTEWTLEGFKFEVQYEGETSWKEVDAKYTVSKEIPEFTQSGTIDVTVTGEYKGVSKTTGTIKAKLTFISPYAIKNLYSTDDESTITVDGIYMGELRDAIILMDGEFGANIYFGNGNVPAHSYVAGVTKLTVTGTVSIYKGLYEIKPNSTGLTALEDPTRISYLSTPVTYIVNGSETMDNPELASRLSNVTGVVSSITDSSGNKNVSVKVNDKSINVFVGSVFATTDVMDKLNASKKDDTEITIEGFTSFFNAFQIQFTKLVEKKEDYTAIDFARQIIELTDAVCVGYDGVTDNSEVLKSVWLVLQDSDHYLALAAEQQTILKNAPANPAGEDLNKGVARYDYLVGKYKLTDFMERNPSPINEVNPLISINNVQDTTWIIVIVGLVGLTAVGGYFFIHRRKED